ncbi:fibronectin type III domain-containing protein [Marinobacter sp. 1Y8]
MFDSTFFAGRRPLALLFTIAIALSGCKGGSQALTSTIFEPAPTTSGSAQSLRNDNTTSTSTSRSDDPLTETPVTAIPANPESARNSGDTTTSEKRSGQRVPSLSWVAPATRADGSKLYTGEIKGYRVYYKLRHEDSYQVIQLTDATKTQLRLADFKAGAYEFAVTTMDTDGLESPRSKAVSVNII